MLSVHIFVQILGEKLTQCFHNYNYNYEKKNIIEEGFPSPRGEKTKKNLVVVVSLILKY